MHIHEAVNAVLDFHNRLKVSPAQPMCREPNARLKLIAGLVLNVAKSLEVNVPNNHDARFLRSHLLLEEIGELIMAMADGDEVAALDGSADLLYVLLGTSGTFDWPIEEAFKEVHASNMTKEKQPDDPLAERVRAKGPNYVAPNLYRVLEKHRCEP